MEHKYELLRKCHGLRFRATLSDKREEGIIKVGEDRITLCYGGKDPGRLFIFERSKTLSFTEQSFGVLPNDFEIVPRDPETYQDWQVGDNISRDSDVCTVIFRCGEVVLFKYEGADETRCCTCPYICEELFCEGFRLVLTDIEKQIIMNKKYEPQDGDVVYAKVRHNDNDAVFIYKRAVENRIYGYAGYNIRFDKMVDTHGFAYITPNIIEDLIEYRPATDEEKQKLFDAMAKQGKRWNAEKKVVEDIQEPEELRAGKSEIKSEIKNDSTHQFKKGEPVLVRDYDENTWILCSFIQFIPTSCFHVTNGVRPSHWKQCIPYNERTMHLLGTTEDYKEEQL